nr:TetR/AcrR family transcriptional regulator [Sediminivirga luteola]
MTPPRAPDPRPARTRRAIFEAVRTLSAQAPDTVSIAAIAREAGISRPAFYAQFPDLDSLAIALLTDAFNEIGAADLRNREGDHDRRSAARVAARALTEHIDAHRAFYRASLEWKVGSVVHETVAAAFARHARDSLLLYPEDTTPEEWSAQSHDLATYIGGGCLALLTSWLREDPPCTPEAMTERLLAVMPRRLVGD